MVKLVDTIDSKSIFRWESLGSSPSASTKLIKTLIFSDLNDKLLTEIVSFFLLKMKGWVMIMFEIGTENLKISDEINRKIDIICRFLW